MTVGYAKVRNQALIEMRKLIRAEIREWEAVGTLHADTGITALRGLLNKVPKNNESVNRADTERLMSTSTMAKLIGWRTERVREVLQKRKLTFQMVPGRGNRWYVTMIGLRAHMPEVYILLESEAAKQSVDLIDYD